MQVGVVGLVGLQLVAYLQLLDFGVVALLPRETAFASGRARVNGDRDAVADTVSLIRGVIRWQMPAVVIAALAGGTLLGILGALIAIPVAAAIMLVINQVFVPRQEEL